MPLTHLFLDDRSVDNSLSRHAVKLNVWLYLLPRTVRCIASVIISMVRALRLLADGRRHWLEPQSTESKTPIELMAHVYLSLFPQKQKVRNFLPLCSGRYHYPIYARCRSSLHSSTYIRHSLPPIFTHNAWVVAAIPSSVSLYALFQTIVVAVMQDRVARHASLALHH